MRCKTCDYRLWNLTERRCPECGSPFRPSEFEFAPNTVQFCCPHCRQPYYGTDEKGLLDPRSFDCVACGRPVDLDETVLLPTEGVEEEQTSPYVTPWLRRDKRGWVRAWLTTVGLGLVQPAKLMRGVPLNSPGWRASLFALITLFVTVAVSILPLGLIVLLPMMAAGTPGGAVPPLYVVVGLIGQCLLATAVSMVALVIWTLLVHLVLRLTGPTAGRMGRTHQALAYSTGGNAASAVPCLGLYLGWIWWVASAVGTVKEGQRVTWLRAAAAVLPWPLLSLGSLIGLFVWGIWAANSAMNYATATSDINSLVVMLNLAGQRDGTYPPHALALMQDSATPWSYVAGDTDTFPEDVAVADKTLDQLFTMSPAALQGVIDTVEQNMDPNAPAHRVGDFVFTYRGIDPEAEAPGLWLVVFYPDPAANWQPAPADTIAAGTLGNGVIEFSFSNLPAELADQNRLRADHGLPPLPDPGTVGAPAANSP